MNQMRTFLWALVLMGAVLPATSAAQSRPLSIDDVTFLLSKPEMRAGIADVARTDCVAFAVDSPTEQRLLQAGADGAMLQAFRTACFTGTEVVVTSWPEGAQVSIDGARVGTTPWTGRFNPSGSSLRITATADGRTQTLTAALNPATRQKAWFAFREDTVALPLVPTRASVIQQLNLEARWRPTEPAPARGRSVGNFQSKPLYLLGMIGGGYGGAKYCGNATHMCGFKDAAIDSVPTRGAAYAIGALGGVLAGAIVADLIRNRVDKSRLNESNRRFSEYSAAMAAWERRMATAKTEWMQNHPDVVAELDRAVAARNAAAARNREIQSRNQTNYRPSQVTPEAIRPPGL
jgi:hypothetical protein